MFHASTKRIEIDVHFIYEKLLAKELDIRYIPTEEQIADGLTKSLLELQFDQIRNKLTVTLSPFCSRGSVKTS